MVGGILKKIFCEIILILVILFSLLSLNVYSISSKDYTINPISESKLNSIWSSINIKKITEDETDSILNTPITGFDLSDNGEIVLALIDERILIIEDDGSFVCAFDFKANGSYNVRWNKDNNIELFLTRGFIIIEFTTDGELVSIKSIVENVDNQETWRLMQKEREVAYNDKVLSVENHLGPLNLLTFQSYTQLVLTGVDGHNNVLYDAGIYVVLRSLLIISFVFIWLFVFGSYFIYVCKKK